jgi:hypothetical protein
MRRTLLLLAVVAAGLLAVPAPEPARAQSGPAMDFLLDQMRRQDTDRRRVIQQRQRREAETRQRRQAQQRALQGAPGQAPRRSPNEISDAAPRVVELPKLPDARVVLVLGDQMAEGLAEGLRDAFASDPGVVVQAVTRPDSGLARAEPVDWVALAREAGRRPNLLAVVVLLGLNDRQPIPDGQGAADIRSDRWRDLYQPRVDQMLAALAERQTPIYWTGLPAMRAADAAAEASFLNDLFKSRTFTANVRFIDVWEGFVDEDGRYVAIGPDVNGQPRRLRRPDGVGLSPAGNRKLAYYVETEIRRDLPVQGPAIAALPPADAPVEQPTRPPVAPAPQQPGAAAPPPPPYVGPVIQLTPVVAVRGAELGQGPAASDAGSEAARVLVRGEALAPRPGRVDDFRWPAPERSVAERPAGAADETFGAAVR